tara:strand:- start:357 stop:620 length:264 start_codon:yes stop_codon:yes gene_type:complete
MAKKSKIKTDNPEIQIDLSLNAIVMDLFKSRGQLEFIYMKAIENKVIKSESIKTGVLKLNEVIGMFHANIEQLIEKGLLVKRDVNEK